MNAKIILSESDIIETIATSFNVDKQNVSLNHFKEPIGYGYSKEDIDKVEITVNVPVNIIKGDK